MLSAGIAAADVKTDPPADGTEDPDNGLGNDLGAKGSQDDLASGGDASDSCAAPDPEITPGEPGAGHLRAPSDRSDNYALVANAGETYTVTLTTTGDVGATLSVHSPACSEVVAFGSSDGEGGQVAVFTADVSGVYTVRVETQAPPPGPPIRKGGGGDFELAGGEPSCYPTCDTSYTLSAVRRSAAS